MAESGSNAGGLSPPPPSRSHRSSGTVRNLLLGSLLAGLILPLVAVDMIGVTDVLAVLGIGAWILVCVRRPFAALSVIIFVFMAGYQRLQLGSLGVPGTGNRGAVLVGDLLWASFFVISVAKAAVSHRWRIPGRLPGPIWSMLPYLVLALVLPVLGAFAYGWPLSFASPGLRRIEWASLAVFAFWLTRRHGGQRFARRLFVLVTAAAVLHAGYAAIQLAYSYGALGPVWVALDTLYSLQNELSWFYYPRTTGLLVNPNSFGLWGAMLFTLAIALYIEGGPDRVWQRAILFGGAAFALLFSGSRSGMVGATAGLAATVVVLLPRPRAFGRTATGIAVLGIALVVVGSLAWPIMPPVLLERFSALGDVLLYGFTEDPNAAARADEWRVAWASYLQQYPAGTWVAPSQALRLSVDSYYVFTAVQGTPAFTLIWLTFLGGAAAVGIRAWDTASDRLASVLGLTLVGWVAIITVQSLTMSPMLQPQLIAPFWAGLGSAVAVAYGQSDRAVPRHTEIR